MEPMTLALIATAVASAAKAGGEYYSGAKQKKAAKNRAHETKRETLASLLQDSLKGSSEMEMQRLNRQARLGKRKSQSMQDTSDLVRGAFNI